MCSSPIRGPNDPQDKHGYIRKIDEETNLPKEREKYQATPPEEDRSLIASLLQLFKKTIDYLVAQTSDAKMVLFSARNHLQELRRHLDILRKEDKSQDLVFLSTFSSSWRDLLEDAPKVHSKPLNDFIEQIQKYPAGQIHTLGFYLLETKNPHWIPFPFMELIQKIHREHMKNPPESELSLWMNAIDRIVSHLQQRKP